jgi:multidrug efflux pump subunit AcrB
LLKLEQLAQTIATRAGQQSAYQVARNAFRADAPQITVTFDRDKAEALGVPLGNALALTLEYTLGRPLVAAGDTPSSDIKICLTA